MCSDPMHLKKKPWQAGRTASKEHPAPPLLSVPLWHNIEESFWLLGAVTKVLEARGVSV